MLPKKRLPGLVRAIMLAAGWLSLVVVVTVVGSGAFEDSGALEPPSCPIAASKAQCNRFTSQRFHSSEQLRADLCGKVVLTLVVWPNICSSTPINSGSSPSIDKDRGGIPIWPSSKEAIIREWDAQWQAIIHDKTAHTY